MKFGITAGLAVLLGGSIAFGVVATVQDAAPEIRSVQESLVIQASNESKRKGAAPAISQLSVPARTLPVPCFGWQPTDAQVERLSLSPDAGPVLRKAYTESSKRIWLALEEPCRQTLGVEDPVVVENMGAAACVALVKSKAPRSRREQMLGALMTEYGRFRADLVQGLGKAVTERLLLSSHLCLDRELLRGIDTE